MFVPHAKVRIVGFGPRPKKKRFHRRRLAVSELVRMPCLVPTIVIVFLGLLAVVAGTGMAISGYLPRPDVNETQAASAENPQSSRQQQQYGASYYLLKMCAYLGPLVMAFGMFAVIVACVLYCEIIDKYTMLVPDKKAAIHTKDELYQVIIGEMKKSYAQSLITAYSKATERTLALDKESYSGEFLSDQTLPFKQPEPLTLDRQIDIECEGYTPSPPTPNKRYSIIQARIQRIKSEDNWLKTSSLPNIRRSENASIRRACRAAKLKQIKKHSLSCDYTMDEARLRRKSMMLRSFLLGNSCSSGELQQKRASRRFSSVKVLPSENAALSWDEVSQIVASTGSFPMTRLVQRRGTFACGDMRTRRMKFLLLLQASESKDNVSIEGRSSVAGIRRKSFIPYTDCDRFIATEERKHTHNRDRRPSFNPFIPAGNRLGQPPPPPANTGRRHSFFPIRRDDQIYISDPYEQRRHSFNPIGINNILKPEYEGGTESRRGSFNPDALHDRSGDCSRRGSHIPPQKSNFLMVPGLETDTLVSERHPAASVDISHNAQTLAPPSDPHISNVKSMPGSPISYDLTMDRQIERRHSYNPPPQASIIHSSKDHSQTLTQTLKVPQIVINSDTSGNFLNVPTIDCSSQERRHSFNCVETTNPRTQTCAAVSFKGVDKPVPQKLSFKLSPDIRLPCPTPTTQHLMPSPSPHHASLHSPTTSRRPPSSPQQQQQHQQQRESEMPTTSLQVRRPSSFKEDMVFFQPLTVSDSRSASPLSTVSCCGSENVGTTRTASITSERTNRTVSPISVVAPDGPLRDESLERPPTPVATSDNFSTSCLFQVTSPGFSFESSNAEHEHEHQHEHGHTHSPISHRHHSFHSKFHRPRSKHRGAEGKIDSPASTGSGPATLLPSSNLNANAALQRSKSASAITSSESASTPPFVSYATLSPAASTARPAIKDKTVRGKQRADNSNDKPS